MGLPRPLYLGHSLVALGQVLEDGSLLCPLGGITQRGRRMACLSGLLAALQGCAHVSMARPSQPQEEKLLLRPIRYNVLRSDDNDG